jgi:small subunit ribosomal protein S20
MALIKAAKKSIRSDAKKRVLNLQVKRAMKASVKNVKDLIVQKKAKEAQAALPEAYKKIDKAMKKGIIKKNTASRKKSRLSKAIKKIS